MSIYDFKPRFQNLLRPTVRKLHARGITANQVTLFACAVSVALGVLLTVLAAKSWLFIMLPLWMFVRMALNAMNGMLAREFGQQSRLGGYLNEITDVVADAALYLPFAFVAPFSPLAAGLFIFFATLSEMCGALGQVYGNGRRYDGPLGKSDRAFAMGVLALCHALFAPLPAWFAVVMWILVVLLVMTCWQRVRRGLA
ncbi:MAG: CDP-alcohol phosphatidyltransferase family protein [Cardiobacteriaceae bacterium]|nr:CDP-alcohol phosphatidyltransferase family protein [Cardiobacteriaceae bacterium]